MAHPTNETREQNAIGLDHDAAHIVRTTNLLARRAVDDRFATMVGAVLLVMGIVLSWSWHVRAEFRDSLPAFTPRASVPSPLYEVTFKERKMTWDELLRSVKANK